jgi:hypothetical protein
MAVNKRLLEAWQNGVPLRDAWWTFAEVREKQLFLELESEGLHLEMVQSLKDELLDRLYAGQLSAIGVKSDGGGGPVYIQRHYFMKTAKIDWDKDTVGALEKVFHHVAVEGERQLAGQALTELGLVDPRPRQSQPELEPAAETRLSEPAPSRERPMGRPPLVPKVCEVIRELMDRDEFTGLAQWEIERLIRRKARERFPTWFPKSDRPTRNTINKALRLEGWPPPPAK